MLHNISLPKKCLKPRMWYLIGYKTFEHKLLVKLVSTVEKLRKLKIRSNDAPHRSTISSEQTPHYHLPSSPLILLTHLLLVLKRWTSNSSFTTPAIRRTKPSLPSTDCLRSLKCRSSSHSMWKQRSQQNSTVLFKSGSQPWNHSASVTI
jgi:hypothetical protein